MMEKELKLAAETPLESITADVCEKPMYEDQDVRVWDIRLAPGESTKLYRSQLWYNYLVIHGSQITVVPHPLSGGEIRVPTVLEHAAGDCGLVHPDGVEMLVNTGDRNYRCIRIENKLMRELNTYKVPDRPPLKTYRPNPNFDRMKEIMKRIPLDTLPENIGTNFYMEDDELQLWGMELQPGDIGDLHYHTKYYFLAFICGDKSGVMPNPLCSDEEFFEMEINPGRCSFSPPRNGSEIAWNIGTKYYRGFQILLKDFVPGQ